jgi:hypothetical protein
VKRIKNGGFKTSDEISGFSLKRCIQIINETESNSFIKDFSNKYPKTIKEDSYLSFTIVAKESSLTGGML